jgi:hypothetical protein
MRTKVYLVYPKDNRSKEYHVDAPSRRIAKWCGANLYNSEYFEFKSAKDMEAVEFEFRVHGIRVRKYAKVINDLASQIIDLTNEEDKRNEQQK